MSPRQAAVLSVTLPRLLHYGTIYGWLLGSIEVYVASVGHGVQWDTVTEYHVVPVHRAMCKCTVIPCSSCPTEHRVPLNPRIPLLACNLNPSSLESTRLRRPVDGNRGIRGFSGTRCSVGHGELGMIVYLHICAMYRYYVIFSHRVP